ncbi:MAG: glycine betaine ABC transporter substrate-binding protein [Actinomycetota bacterium]
MTETGSRILRGLGRLRIFFALSLPVAVMSCSLAAGCQEESGFAAPRQDDLTIGYVEWDESVALANLTKVVLEDELGYEVELRREAPDEVLHGVASGELDAFQDLWLPTHDDRLREVEGEVKVLNPWLIGTTRQSLAVPSYVGVRRLDRLGTTGAEEVFGTVPGGAPVEIPEEFLAAYPLDKRLEHESVEAMLADADRLYQKGEPFVFIAYAPHWMNDEYELNYLEPSDDELSGLVQPARLHPVARRGLAADDPFAYAFLDAILLASHQVVALEQQIRAAEGPEEGARAWAQKNSELVETWIQTAKNRAAD